MLALVPDEQGRLDPKTITILDALTHYIRHQEDVVLRRTRFDLEKAEARQHIVEGLLIAIDNIDEVIAIIRASHTEDQAKTRLSERFGFTEKQAQHIVDMRLGRLTGLEREKLETEHKDLQDKIDYFRRVIQDDALLHEIIKKEILTVRAKFSDDRRSEIIAGEDEDFDDESLIREEEVVVTLTHLGYVKRLPVDTYRSQHRGGRGVTGLSTREEDFVEKIITTSTHATLLCFTNRGRVFRLKGYQVPEASRQAKGTAIVNLLQLEGSEKVKTVIPVDTFEQDAYLMMATMEGVVKKSLLSDYAKINKGGLIAINIREDDELVGAQLTDGKQEIALVTRRGMSIRFSEDDVRSTGRNTMGVRGISLRHDDRVIGMAPIVDGLNLLVVSENGFGKRTEMDEYRTQTRGGMGLMTYKIKDKTVPLVRIALVDENQDLILINDNGVVIRLAVFEIPILSRVTQGVTLMRSKDGKIVDIAVVEHEEPEDEAVEAENSEEDTADAEDMSCDFSMSGNDLQVDSAED